MLLVGYNKEERINLWSDHYLKTFTLREGRERERGKRMREDRKEIQRGRYKIRRGKEKTGCRR